MSFGSLGGIPTGRAKKEKKKNLSNTVLNIGLLTPREEGKNGPSRGHLNSTPFYNSVYIAVVRINTRRFPMSRPLWPSTRILKKKKRKCKLEDFDKGSFKVLLARSEAEDPLYLLLIPSAWAERSQGKEAKTSPEVMRPGLKVIGPERMSLYSCLGSTSICPFPHGLTIRK